VGGMRRNSLRRGWIVPVPPRRDAVGGLGGRLLECSRLPLGPGPAIRSSGAAGPGGRSGPPRTVRLRAFGRC
jgi:hypothetical protein